MQRDYRRDADKLYGIIARKPGIKFGELYKYTQGWSRDDVNDALRLLLSLGKIREENTRPRRGPPGRSFFVNENWQPQQTNESQLEAAARELSEAKQQLSQAFGLVEMVSRRLAELQTAEPVTCEA